jgi:hypothetical protein
LIYFDYIRATRCLACDFVLIPVSSVSDPISHPDPRPV